MSWKDFKEIVEISSAYGFLYTTVYIVFLSALRILIEIFK